MKSVILLLLFSVIPAVAKLVEWDTPAKTTGKLSLINNVLCIDTGERELNGNLGETISNNRGGIVAIDFSAVEDRDKLLKKIGQAKWSKCRLLKSHCMAGWRVRPDHHDQRSLRPIRQYQLFGDPGSEEQ